MSATTSFSPQLIGQTEKALNAILARQLSGTGLTEPQWVTLVLAVGAGPGEAAEIDRDRLAAQVIDALKVDDETAQARIDELVAAGLLRVVDGSRPSVAPCGEGRALHGRIRAATGEITQRLWGDLPADDLAAAGRVLATILVRANAQLGA
jgi:DNA-binding MarR family transcriptional regulator